MCVWVCVCRKMEREKMRSGDGDFTADNECTQNKPTNSIFGSFLLKKWEQMDYLCLVI